jgi:hypothetical protein
LEGRGGGTSSSTEKTEPAGRGSEDAMTGRGWVTPRALATPRTLGGGPSVGTEDADTEDDGWWAAQAEAVWHVERTSGARRSRVTRGEARPVASEAVGQVVALGGRVWREATGPVAVDDVRAEGGGGCSRGVGCPRW